MISCSSDSGTTDPDGLAIEFLPYYGTYLYHDNDCGGQDIQYAIIDDSGITFFDLLSDGCDDTVECYAKDVYELTETSTDTFIIVSNEISNGELYLHGDTAFTISYQNSNGTISSYGWEKIKDEIYSFDPICDEEYGNTKNIADILAYAVGDNGSLLWKRYLDGGFWDLGTGVTPRRMAAI